VGVFLVSLSQTSFPPSKQNHLMSGEHIYVFSSGPWESQNI